MPVVLKQNAREDIVMPEKPTYEELEQRLNEIEKTVVELKSDKTKLRIMQDAVASSINAIGITDLQGKMIYVNDSCIKVWGYNHENEMLGRSLSEFWEGDGIFNTVKELQEKGVASGDDIGKRKDGSLFDVQFSTNIFEDEVGNPAYMFGSFFDITDRKRAEEALQESDAKFRTVAEESPDIIFISKKDGVAYQNKRCEEMLGYKSEEIYSPGFNFLKVLAPESLELARSALKKYFIGAVVEPLEYTLISKDGKRISTVINTKLINYGGEKAILGIITDITERKQAEEALKESEKRDLSGFPNTNLTNNYYQLKNTSRKSIRARMGPY